MHNISVWINGEMKWQGYYIIQSGNHSLIRLSYTMKAYSLRMNPVSFTSCATFNVGQNNKTTCDKWSIGYLVVIEVEYRI